MALGRLITAAWCSGDGVLGQHFLESSVLNCSRTDASAAISSQPKNRHTSLSPTLHPPEGSHLPNMFIYFAIFYLKLFLKTKDTFVASLKNILRKKLSYDMLYFSSSECTSECTCRLCLSIYVFAFTCKTKIVFRPPSGDLTSRDLEKASNAYEMTNLATHINKRKFQNKRKFLKTFDLYERGIRKLGL